MKKYINQTLSKEEFLKTEIKLSESTLKMIEELEEISDFEVVFKIISEQQIAYDASIRVARGCLRVHQISINIYKNLKPEMLNYLIAHELQHGLRIYKGSPEDRAMFGTRREQIETEILKMKNINPMVRPILGSLYNNLSLLLINAPVDSQIERDLYEKYPDLRESQKSYLESYKDVMLESLTNKNIGKIMPREITNPVNILNCAYLISIANIIGDYPGNKYKSYGALYKKGVEISKIFMEEDEGQKSDVRKILETAKLMNCEQLINKLDFEASSFLY